MIDFDNWFAKYRCYCGSDCIPKCTKASVGAGRQNITSAYDFGELAEQILGDLDLEEQTKRFSNELEKGKVSQHSQLSVGHFKMWTKLQARIQCSVIQVPS
jgi:hypothetical protein